MRATVSAQEFNRDVSATKRAAQAGPVTITDRGRPAFVLMSIRDFERMRDSRTIVDWLQSDIEIEFEPGRVDSLPRAAEL